MAHTCVAFNSLIFSSNPTSSSDSHKLSFSSRFVFSYPSFLFRFRIYVFLTDRLVDETSYGKCEKLINFYQEENRFHLIEFGKCLSLL